MKEMLMLRIFLQMVVYIIVVIKILDDNDLHSFEKFAILFCCCCRGMDFARHSRQAQMWQCIQNVRLRVASILSHLNIPNIAYQNGNRNVLTFQNATKT